MTVEKPAPGELFNVTPSDRRLHANLLVVHEDNKASPSCTAAHIGHYLRYARGTAAPFPSGNYLTTAPFLIETSRLGKPFDRVTHEDLASLKQKYELTTESQFTVLRRREVSIVDASLLQADIDQYAATYHARRHGDVEQAFADAVANINRLEVMQDAVFEAFFSLESVPIPVASIALASRELDESAKALALLWQMISSPNVRQRLEADSTEANSAVVRIHAQNDGTFCLGIARPNPLALVAWPSEIAHFHHVASDEESAEKIAEILADLLTQQFRLNSNVVASVQKSVTGRCCASSEPISSVFQLMDNN